MEAIVAFLTARLDEREAIAQRAMTDWNDQDWVELDGDPLDHIDANDPHAVLADIGAKRAIVALHWEAAESWARFSRCATCEVNHPCLTLLALVRPYAEHTDFDPAWRV